MAQIEIKDLVGKAVANAGERRNRALTEAGLSDLSGEEMNQITGGIKIIPIILGLWFPDNEF